MANERHSFYCGHCEKFIAKDTPGLLASELNRHNQLLHPLDYSCYNEKNILLSEHYSGPFVIKAPTPMPSTALRNISKEWGDAQHAPDITEADRQMLRKGLVRWD